MEAVLLFSTQKCTWTAVDLCQSLGLPPKKIDQRSAESNSQGFQGSALKKASRLSRKDIICQKKQGVGLSHHRFCAVLWKVQRSNIPSENVQHFATLRGILANMLPCSSLYILVPRTKTLQIKIVLCQLAHIRAEESPARKVVLPTPLQALRYSCACSSCNASWWWQAIECESENGPTLAGHQSMPKMVSIYFLKQV